MKKLGMAAALLSQIVSLVFFQVAHAADPMDAAQEAVRKTYEVASSKAFLAVNEDFNFALAETMKELMVRQDFSASKAGLLLSQDELRKGFEKIASLNPEEVSKLQTQLATVFEDYKELVRRRYDDSYIAAQARSDARASLLMASRTLQYFESNCTTGRGIGGIGVGAFQYPSLPKSDFRVQVTYGSPGTQSSFDTSYSATGSAAEKDRNTAVNVSATAASITTSLALSGGGGTAVAVAQTMAPFMVGGAVVIAVVALYMSEQEKIKAENRVVEAKMYAFHESADDRTVAKYYVEHCASLKKDVSIVRKLLDAALDSPEQMRAMAAAVPNLDEEVAKFQALIEKRRVAYEAMMAAKENNEEQLKALKAIDVEIKEASKPEKVANVMLAFLLDKDARLQSELTSVNFQAVDLAQKRAFQQIQQLVGLVLKKNFQKFLSGSDEIASELKALDRFVKARRLFKDVLTAQIKQIFGRIEADRVQSLEKQLRQETKALMASYAHVPDVVEFARQVKSLTGSLE